jgi:S1-C subfamily serine protease
MTVRRLLLIILFVGGFCYITTTSLPTGVFSHWLHMSGGGNGLSTHSLTSGINLTETSAAPSYDAEEQNNISVYKKALPSVVNITSHAVAFDFFYGPVPQEGQGSGFILDKEGHILTNNHVIADAQQVEVTLYDKHKYKAKVVAVDKAHDLALIQINAPNLTPAILSDSSNITVGQKVYAIGNPFGLSGTMTTGIVSSIRSIKTQDSGPIENAIQTDAAINPGNSGGPLLNSRGDVIGINTLIASNGVDQNSGIGFAIPINTAKAVLDDFSRYGRVRRPSLGVLASLSIGPDLAQQMGLIANYGVLIERIQPGGAADRAGLHGGSQKAYLGNTLIYVGGDLVVAVDGQEVANEQDLEAVMDSHHSGDKVTVTAFRGRNRMDVAVVLADDKAETSI